MKRAKHPHLSNAEFAFAISHILRTASVATVTMSEGMWNPEYCSASADMFALSIIDDLEHQIDNIKKRLPRG
jgi:hypothetical protein